MSFGFDPTTVFGDVRKTAKKTRKKRKDDMTDMMADAVSDNGFGLGIDTFSLAEPRIDPLGLGEDFGSRIGAPAGQANGKGSLVGTGGFLGVIGSQALTVPPLVGRKPTRKAGRRKGTRLSQASAGLSPLQKRTGSRFGEVDKKFGDTLFSNIEGARKRISAFREGRRVKEEAPEERPALPAPQEPAEPQQTRFREPPALPAPPESPRSETRPMTELTRGRAPT